MSGDKDRVGAILIVEDDEGLRALLAEELEDRGFVTLAAADAEAGIEQVQREGVALVLTDVRLPGMTGVDLLSRLQELPEPPACILITAFGTVPQAVEALKAGADDFLTKPVDLDHLVLRIRRTLDMRNMREEVARLRRGLGDDDGFHGLVGESAPMRSLFRRISRAARAEGAVLVLGESGTGKDLVARAVHAESERRDRPFVPINCASVPTELLESEFFGHAAGAFTGARAARRGLFAAADGGTLFLDEISEMPLSLQAKLLRVLEDHRIRPVGSDTEVAVDVRVVAATNRDPDEAVSQDLLREDLFYRLEALALQLPPLRERGDDLELLAGRFLAQLCARQGKGDMVLSEEAVDCLRAYRFPGNVRELFNALERAVTFAEGRVIRPRHLPRRVRVTESARPDAAPDAPPGVETRDQPTLQQVELRYIRQVLDRVGGNKREASRVLGIGRRTLYRRLEEMGEEQQET